MSHSVSTELQKEDFSQNREDYWFFSYRHWSITETSSIGRKNFNSIWKALKIFFAELHFRMLWLFIFGLSTSTWALKNESSFQCHDNQWLCGTQCIHQRSFCTLSGTCHPDFPRPCGDGQRCYHRLDNCWNAACHNSNCERDANLDGLDKNQVHLSIFINTGYRNS